MAPASDLARIGIEPIGMTDVQAPDGTVREYPFGLARVELMGEVTAGRVIFGPEDIDPIIGTTALESVGMR